MNPFRIPADPRVEEAVSWCLRRTAYLARRGADRLRAASERVLWYSIAVSIREHQREVARERGQGGQT